MRSLAQQQFSNRLTPAREYKERYNSHRGEEDLLDARPGSEPGCGLRPTTNVGTGGHYSYCYRELVGGLPLRLDLVFTPTVSVHPFT